MRALLWIAAALVGLACQLESAEAQPPCQPRATSWRWCEAGEPYTVGTYTPGRMCLKPGAEFDATNERLLDAWGREERGRMPREEWPCERLDQPACVAQMIEAQLARCYTIEERLLLDLEPREPEWVAEFRSELDRREPVLRGFRSFSRADRRSPTALPPSRGESARHGAPSGSGSR